MTDLPPEDGQRLDRLSRLAAPKRAITHSRSRTKIVRALRWGLPLAALGIMTAVLAWPRMDEIKPILMEEAAGQKTGSNELINPRFESQDNRQQPFTVTAEKAIQSAEDIDLVVLQEPRGQLVMADGTSVAAQARRGAYRQEAEKLYLEESVRLSYTQGYWIQSDRLMIDLKNDSSWTDAPVEGQGPAGSITATGLQADMKTGTLVFTGPARLTLKESIKGL